MCCGDPTAARERHYAVQFHNSRHVFTKLATCFRRRHGATWLVAAVIGGAARAGGRAPARPLASLRHLPRDASPPSRDAPPHRPRARSRVRLHQRRHVGDAGSCRTRPCPLAAHRARAARARAVRRRAALPPGGGAGAPRRHSGPAAPLWKYLLALVHPGVALTLLAASLVAEALREAVADPRLEGARGAVWVSLV